MDDAVGIKKLQNGNYFRGLHRGREPLCENALTAKLISGNERLLSQPQDTDAPAPLKQQPLLSESESKTCHCSR